MSTNTNPFTKCGRKGRPKFRWCQRESRVRRPLGDWWKNHFLSKQDSNYENIAFVMDPTTLGETLKSDDADE
jgi:hypothetical protein